MKRLRTKRDSRTSSSFFTVSDVLMTNDENNHHGNDDETEFIDSATFKHKKTVKPLKAEIFPGNLPVGKHEDGFVLLTSDTKAKCEQCWPAWDSILQKVGRHLRAVCTIKTLMCIKEAIYAKTKTTNVVVFCESRV